MRLLQSLFILFFTHLGPLFTWHIPLSLLALVAALPQQKTIKLHISAHHRQPDQNQHPPQSYRSPECPTRLPLNPRITYIKPQASDKDYQPLLSSIYHGASSLTSTTLLPTSLKMTSASNGHNLRGRGDIKKTSKAAADDLMKQVALEKKIRE